MGRTAECQAAHPLAVRRERSDARTPLQCLSVSGAPARRVRRCIKTEEHVEADEGLASPRERGLVRAGSAQNEECADLLNRDAVIAPTNSATARSRSRAALLRVRCA
jgi:hypothetical protein